MASLTPPVPTVTPYLTPNQGGNYNVPVGQTGIPYKQDFIGPIPYNYAPVGAPVSSAKIYNPTPPPPPQITQPTAPSGGSISEGEALARGWDINNLPAGYSRAGADTSARDNQIRNDINSGYDSYLSSLDQMIGNIPSQRAGMEQIANNSYSQNVSDLEAQRSLSMTDLSGSRRKNQEQQVRSLQDIAENIRNLYRTGNVMLGTKGAGDSSASNQYAYAVQKIGSKARGDVMNQTRSIENDIADREAKLNTVVTQETGRLKTERDNAILQIAQYFQDQQNALLQAKAKGQLDRGTSLAQLSSQLLQNAQAQLMQADADFRNRQNTLMTWAANNATTIGQLKSNLAAVGQYATPNVSAPALNGTPQFDAQGNLTTRLFSTNAPEERPRTLSSLGTSLFNLT